MASKSVSKRDELELPENQDKESSSSDSEDIIQRRNEAKEYVETVLQSTMRYSQFLFEKMVTRPKLEVKVKRRGKKRQKLSEGTKVKEGQESIEQPDLFTGGTLMKHQLEGFQWLKSLYDNGISAILADEMGLGKTAQSIAMIASLISCGIEGPFLVTAPLSTLKNWIAEFKRFAPKIPIVLCHGQQADRRMIYNKLNEETEEVLPVVIAGYDSVILDFKYIKKIVWKYVVIDEAHRLKNSQSKFFRKIKLLEVGSILLLTGTPLQNNISELWSLLNIVLPEVFNNMERFKTYMGLASLANDDDEQIVSEELKDSMIRSIHQILTPFLLRRNKSDVNIILPPKKELVVDVPFTTLQKTYYDAILDGTIEILLGIKNKNPKIILDEKRKRKQINYDESNSEDEEEEEDDDEEEEEEEEDKVEEVKDDEKEETEVEKESEILAREGSTNLSERNRINLRMSHIPTLLRKVCLHPYLICCPIDTDKNLKVDENLVKSCGKLLLLDIMLPELRRRGHKVLIFSQFVMMLDILDEYCSFRKFPIQRIDGDTDLDTRDYAMYEFNNNPSSFVFLLSTRAGGLVINLTSADTVIIYDSDWNPQRDLQATDRCHRIGQTRPVVVYRLLVKNTIEDYVLKKATTKKKLEKLIIKKGRFSTNDTLTKFQEPLSEEDLLSELRDSKLKVCSVGEEILNQEKLNELLDRTDMYT